MQLNILIVEDNLSFAIELEMLVSEIGCFVTDRVDNSEDAKSSIQTSTPDIILMDININGEMSGTEFGKSINHLDIPIIYITSFTEEVHFLNANESKNFAYLIKPVQKFEMIQTIKILTKNRNITTSSKAAQKIIIKKNGSYFNLKPENIKHIKSADNYCDIFVVNGDRHMIRKKISKIEIELDKSIFIRTHRSHIVNINYIDAVDMKNSLITINDTNLPLSKKYKFQFLTLYKSKFKNL